MFALDGVLALTLVVPLWRFRRAVPRAPGLLGGPRLETQRRLLRDRRATLVYAAVFVEGAAFFGGLGYLGALLHDKYRLSLDEIGLVLVLERRPARDESPARAHRAAPRREPHDPHRSATAVLGQLVESRGYGALLLSCGVALVLVGVAAPRLTAAPAASHEARARLAPLGLDR